MARMDVNWAPARVRRNFRIDTFSAICGGVYISVLITFMPIVVRRLGGSTIDVAIVIAAPFVGHLLSPISAYLLMGFPQVRVVAGTVTLARATFLAGVLVAATPLMLAMTTVVTFVISVAQDRKSTRLNSSPLVISYAVFCLKKKTPLAVTGSRGTHPVPNSRPSAGCAGAAWHR